MTSKSRKYQEPPIISHHFVDAPYDKGKFNVHVDLIPVMIVEADELRRRGAAIHPGSEGGYGIFILKPAFERAYEGYDPAALDNNARAALNEKALWDAVGKPNKKFDNSPTPFYK